MTISIREVTTRSSLKAFIKFPASLYKKNPNWLPPLYIDEWNFHNKNKNKAYAVSDTILFTAHLDNKIVGRIMGIINYKYNEMKSENNARFFAFECIDDSEVAFALLRSVEDWARSKGMEKIIGPFGFSDKDPQGFLITGFEYPAIIITPYNPEYYNRLVEEYGFQKEVDLVEYRISVPENIPEFYQKILNRVSQNNHIKCIEFSKKKELKPYIIPVLRLMNETFSEVYGSYELTDDEMKKLAADYMPVLDPEFVKVILNDENEAISFFIGLPDIAPGLKKARGRLFPLGLYFILRSLKHTDQLVLMLGGIKPAYQGKGLDVLMGVKMLESTFKRGYKKIDSHLELETNTKVRAEMERMGGQIIKKFRIYQKSI